MPAASRPLAALLLALTLGACSGPVAVYQTPGMSAAFTDGRFKVEVGGGTYALRVSTLPVVDGEKVVMRILNESTKAARPLIAGYVTNTNGGGVANIRMQAQTLDAQGQVIDTGTALAPGYVGGFARTYFEVPLEKT